MVPSVIQVLSYMLHREATTSGVIARKSHNGYILLQIICPSIKMITSVCFAVCLRNNKPFENITWMFAIVTNFSFTCGTTH